MSLATQCPNCRTTFKVADDQLKLKAGLVRCGICQQVFNGVTHLLPFTDSDTAEEVIPLKSSPIESDVGQSATIETTLPPQASNQANNVEHDHIEPPAQPSFVRQPSTPKRSSWLFSVATLVLALLLIGQTLYLLRNFIATTFPASEKTLRVLCEAVHCQIQLPTQLSALSVQADELSALPHKNSFELSLFIRNQSRFAQAWPHLELTLKNPQNQPILRRVFTPSEYLPAHHDLSTGLPAHQEQAVDIYFELNQLQASDYAVAVFYP